MSVGMLPRLLIMSAGMLDGGTEMESLLLADMDCEGWLAGTVGKPLVNCGPPCVDCGIGGNWSCAACPSSRTDTSALVCPFGVAAVLTGVAPLAEAGVAAEVGAEAAAVAAAVAAACAAFVPRACGAK